MIGIFDSGIGGVTVLKEIIKELPNYTYIYYSDSVNNPYGNKSTEELNMICINIVDYLINMGCKIIVIACNTASSICKDILRHIFKVPIIAIEPAIKLLENTQDKTLIMATVGTINSNKFRELYNKYGNSNMKLLSCPNLANLIEEGKQKEIKEYLIKVLDKDTKNIILGCTHYPLIKNEIKEIIPNVNFYDGSIGLTKNLKRIIDNINLPKTKLNIIFIDTSNNKDKLKRFNLLLENK